ncbi:MAG: hypothetical protein RIQ93_158 [Verrucomicrobiota bacterium]
MRRTLALLTSAFLVLTAPAPAATPFPQAGSDLKPDPQVRFGTLPNGLRYVVRPNKEPKSRASLRLLIEAGALHETEQQRGLAHFLEHLAFNGSEHYAPGTLIEFFQRMGMNFGGDTNASTGFERTLYLLELPDTKDAVMAEGLRVFADYAGGLLLQTPEIDKERGIILSEKRTRDSVGYRTLVAQYGFMLEGTLFPRRFPIGETEIIQKATREEFLDYYNTWYRPELMSVVIVGDVDPVAVEKQIVAALTPLKARAAARPKPDLGKVGAAEGTRVFYHPESEAPNTDVTIATVSPYVREPDTAAKRLKYLPRSLAHAIINRRLSILAKKENAPFTSGSAGIGEAYNFYRESYLSLTCRNDQWTAALGVADQELRRALEHGFQPAELSEVVSNFRNSLEQAVKTSSTRRSDGLAQEIAESLLEGDVFTTPEDDLALFTPALDRITTADCLTALRTAWSPNHRLIMVTGNARIAPTSEAAPEKTIAAIYEKSRAVAVAAPETIADVKWAYTEFGAPGKVVKREEVKDLDLTLITFANGVRLNLKKTDFEANRIRTSVRVGSGQLTEPKDKPGLAAYVNQTFTAGGLSQHSADDLRRILAGKTVGSGFSAGGDAFVSSGNTNGEDLLLQLQLITAQLTDPGYRPEAARQARKALEEAYLSFEHTPSGPFTLEVPKLLASGDHRFGLPPKEVMLQRTSAEAKAWLAPELARGAIEVALVGDLDVEASIAAVAKTLGALPKRDAKPAHDDLRQVKFPATPFVREFTIQTEIPKGNVVIYWPTTDGREIHRTRRLNLLSEVFTDRLRIKVREEMGDAYSPGAGSNPSDLYPGYGYLTANVTIDPPRAKAVADLLVEIARDLAEKGVTEDELERAKKPVLTSLRESARTNGYWIGNVLARAQERPEMLDWSRSRYADMEAISKADLDALAKTYLRSDRASRVMVLPAAPVAKTPPGPSGPTAP